MTEPRTTTGPRPYHWLAAIPIVALLAGIPFVNRVEPYVFGLPLLMAWIVAWVIAMSATNGVIYLLDRRRERNPR
ncbi:MAG TPA: DUF3311 domain-containing protein [Gemmatimonadaceae bacterium]